MLLQAELEAEAVGAHPADARLDYGRAGIRKAQVHRVATHLDAELAYGLHGDEAGHKPVVNSRLEVGENLRMGHQAASIGFWVFSSPPNISIDNLMDGFRKCKEMLNDGRRHVD